jgi:hypothetical protein
MVTVLSILIGMPTVAQQPSSNAAGTQTTHAQKKSAGKRTTHAQKKSAGKQTTPTQKK